VTTQSRRVSEPDYSTMPPLMPPPSAPPLIATPASCSEALIDAWDRPIPGTEIEQTGSERMSNTAKSPATAAHAGPIAYAEAELAKRSNSGALLASTAGSKPRRGAFARNTIGLDRVLS
jgi:hypothetical protein